MNGLPDPRTEGNNGLHGSRTSLPVAPLYGDAAGLRTTTTSHLPPSSADARTRHSGAGTPQFRCLAGGGSGGQFLLSRSSRGSLSNLSCPVVGSGSGSGFMALQRSISGNSIHIEDQFSAHVNKKKLGADSDPVPTFQKKILIRNLQGTVFLNSPHKSFTDFDFLKKI